MVLYLSIVAALSAGCTSRQQSGEGIAAPDTAPSPKQESIGVELYESEAGLVRYRINAAYMATYESGDSTYVLLSRRVTADPPVVAELYENGQKTATIEASEMRFFEKDRRFEARGAVIVETSTGRRLETEFLIWREADKRVVAPGFVRIKSPTEDMQGYGFDSDEQLESFSLQRVTGRYYLEEE
ncbi:MAG: LPS export ABC transporter periplasmic protein LptC [Rhodothermales bacterium]